MNFFPCIKAEDLTGLQKYVIPDEVIDTFDLPSIPSQFILLVANNVARDYGYENYGCLYDVVNSQVVFYIGTASLYITSLNGTTVTVSRGQGTYMTAYYI